LSGYGVVRIADGLHHPSKLKNDFERLLGDLPTRVLKVPAETAVSMMLAIWRLD
jgi:hypothetical protein